MTWEEKLAVGGLVYAALVTVIVMLTRWWVRHE